MLRKVKFLGNGYENEGFTIALYDKYKDVKFIKINKGEEKWLDEEAYAYLLDGNNQLPNIFSVVEVKYGPALDEVGTVDFTFTLDGDSNVVSSEPVTAISATGAFEVIFDDSHIQVISQADNTFTAKYVPTDNTAPVATDGVTTYTVNFAVIK